MNPALHGFLRTLRDHEAELRALGVRHASIFGSVARGDAREGSDVDVLVDLDVVNRRAPKPLMRDNILHDAVDAF